MYQRRTTRHIDKYEYKNHITRLMTRGSANIKYDDINT